MSSHGVPQHCPNCGKFPWDCECPKEEPVLPLSRREERIRDLVLDEAELRIEEIKERAATCPACKHPRAYYPLCMECLRKKMHKIIAMAGNPDPAEACRLIIEECKEWTDEHT